MSQTVSIQTLRGNSVQCILSSCQSPKGIVITAAGAGGGPGPGGSDGPYYLYQKLARKLPSRYSISVLQIIYHLFSDMQAKFREESQKKATLEKLAVENTIYFDQLERALETTKRNANT